MLRLTLQMFVLVLVLPIVACTAPPTAEYPIPDIVELSTADRDALLAAPQTAMNLPPPIELSEAIRIGTIENVKVEKFTAELAAEIAEEIGRNTVTTYQGWIRYTPVVQTKNRLYRPVVLCISHDEQINWFHCEDMSWIRLQTSEMEKPIRFNGELSDENVVQIFSSVDQANLISTTDNQRVTADKIYEIIKYPHAGNRVNVYVTTAKKGFTDVIYLAQVTNSEGLSAFEVSEFRCGQE